MARGASSWLLARAFAAVEAAVSVRASFNRLLIHEVLDAVEDAAESVAWLGLQQSFDVARHGDAEVKGRVVREYAVVAVRGTAQCICRMYNMIWAT